ncbi:MAG: hypothetical protein ABEI32_14525 [Halothece sp.]
MASVNIGELIKTATKNIHYDRQLTEEELSLAQELAPHIRETGGNWIPVYVKEIEIHNFQLIGSPIILEANKIAEQKFTYCIPIGENKEVETQIQKGQSSFNQNNTNTGTNRDNLVPLMKRIEELEKQFSEQNEKVNKIFKHVVPDDELLIDEGSKEHLENKLSRVPGIGEKTLPKLVDDILKKRPFHRYDEIRRKLNLFQPPKSKSKAPVPRSDQLWQAITSLYEIKCKEPVQGEQS